MKIDTALKFDLADPASASASARSLAELGFDRLFTPDTNHDPFLPLALAAGAADVDLGTNIAVAFARNPMTVAMSARDLHQLTGGRFSLGLGSQVKGHVTRRFSMPWSEPAARMREFIEALRAIWNTWENGAPLRFEGRFYQHTLMSPLFDPGPTGHGTPPVMLAAVGTGMAEVAGEVADGLYCHGFTTPSYIQHVTTPALERGLATSGRTRADVELTVPVMIGTGLPGADLAAEEARIRRQIAFYASTPAYVGVLEHHGWADLHPELLALSKAQRWDEMTDQVDDEMLHTMAVIAPADRLAEVLLERYAGVVDRISPGLHSGASPEIWVPVIRKLKEGQSE